MGIAKMEELVSTVGAILKTLECPICLELLKVPVSAGCGHFFCRHCVTAVLQSSYRAPCPLCKQSFTRRSVQTASQRQSVISAARTLAQTCTSLTGANFIALDKSIKEGRKSVDATITVPLKKYKASSNKEKENAPSRKRKSIENEEDVEKTVQDNVSDLEMVECPDVKEPLSESDKKRACPDSEEDESEDDLPRLDVVFSQWNSFQKSSVIHDTVTEKPLFSTPSVKVSKLKTYSSFRKNKRNLVQLNSVESDMKDMESREDCHGDFISNNKNGTENESSLKETHDSVQVKNKINALKNKTNEGYSDKHIIRNDRTGSKLAHAKNFKKEEMDLNVKSKENEITSSPSAPYNHLSAIKSRQSYTKKLRNFKKKNQNRVQSYNAASNLLMEEKKKKGNKVSSNTELVTVPTDKVDTEKDCHTLNEITFECEKPNEQVLEKCVDDPFKSIGLTDTAVSVNSVRSPLAIKMLSLHRSPGWSRVKEVKKDFKMKKFTSLHVEKNSPNISLKSANQEPTVDSLDQSVDVIRKNGIENKRGSGNENTLIDMSERHSLLGKKTDQEKGFSLSKSHSTGDSNEISQNEAVYESVLESVNSVDMDSCDLHVKISKEINSSLNNKHGYSANSGHDLSTSPVGIAESKIAINNLPAVSITSNSLIYAKYADTCDKISAQNVVKTKEIICELQNKGSINNDLGHRDGNIVSKYVIQDNCCETNNALFNNHTSEMKQGTFPLPTHISEYQSFHTHSVLNDDDDGFQYVEQSQQTSQMFNFDLQNSVCDKLNSVIQQAHACRETTKVVKRTCLTLEEIQDCFHKSNQSQCSETLCSVPFLDGLFKLHVGVSDQTLNISILKVTEPTLESDNAQNSVSMLSNKCIQTSSNLLPLLAVLPSSNVGSECSQPDTTTDPFPYLNKLSGTKVMKQTLPLSGDETVHTNELSIQEREVTLMPDEPTLSAKESFLEKRAVDQSNCEIEVSENQFEMSEVIHLSPKPALGINEPLQKRSSSDEFVPQVEVCRTADKSPLREDRILTVEQSPLKINEILMECDLPANHCSHLLSEMNKREKMDSDLFSNSDKEDSLKKLEMCVLQGHTGKEKKESRLSLKKKSTIKSVYELSDESDLENSESVTKLSKEVESNKTVLASVKPVNPVSSTAERLCSPKELQKTENLKNAVHNSVGEAPSLNSIFSEDVPETNASEIIQEIEDLADKIKSLEEKLKQCGHSDLQKSMDIEHQECQQPERVEEPVSSSDSEDSFDLFPQSVPPTPPTRV